MAIDSQQQKLTIPFKTRMAIAAFTKLTDIAQRPGGSANRLLVPIFDFRIPPFPFPINSVSSSDFVVDRSRNIWFRLFTPHISGGGDSIPVVIFFHGGGFAWFSPNTRQYNSFCRRFAKEVQAYVISVNYRLAPEHRYPAQYDDGFAVLKYLEQNCVKILPKNADLSRCFLAGDSAGGNIAHNVAVRYCRRAFTAVKLVGLIAIQPFFGGEKRTESEKRLVGKPLINTKRTDWAWKAFLPVGSNRDHVAANVDGPNAIDISELDYPETMVVVGGFDPLIDWQKRYCEWINLSGKCATLIEFPNMFHGFNLFSEVQESGLLLHRIKDFIAEPGALRLIRHVSL